MAPLKVQSIFLWRIQPTPTSLTRRFPRRGASYDLVLCDLNLKEIDGWGDRERNFKNCQWSQILFDDRMAAGPR